MVGAEDELSQENRKTYLALLEERVISQPRARQIIEIMIKRIFTGRTLPRSRQWN